MKIWSCIERRHDEIRFARLILPVTTLALALGGLAYGATLLLFG